MSVPKPQRIPSRRETLVLAFIVAVYVILGVCYAVWTPAWQVPDEPAHYNYLRHIAETGQLPELRPGDYPAEYLEEIKARRFPPQMSIDAIRYEAHQPPLYYGVAALWARIWAAISGTTPSLVVLRLLSVALGAAVVLGAYGVGRRALPNRPAVALGAAALVATLPMHVAMTSAVNSDVMAELLLVAVGSIVVVARPTTWTPRRALLLGVLLGLAFLTKMQSYVAFAIAGLALCWDVVFSSRGDASERLTWRRALGIGAIMAACVALLAAPWLLRNMRVYGPADPFGLGRHAEVVVGQLTTRDFVTANGWGALLRAFVVTTFRSFWGQFGWMGVVLPPRVYLALALTTGLVTLGFVQWLAEAIRARTLAPHQVRALAILGAWVAATTAGYLWWNTQFLQHQGRYLFPALTPLGIAFALGLQRLLTGRQQLALGALGAGALALLTWGLVSGDLEAFTIALLAGAAVALPVARWIERRWPGVAMAAVYLAMAAFALYCLFVHIVPALT